MNSNTVDGAEMEKPPVFKILDEKDRKEMEKLPSPVLPKIYRIAHLNQFLVEIGPPVERNTKRKVPTERKK